MNRAGPIALMIIGILTRGALGAELPWKDKTQWRVVSGQWKISEVAGQPDFRPPHRL